MYTVFLFFLKHLWSKEKFQNYDQKENTQLKTKCDQVHSSAFFKAKDQSETFLKGVPILIKQCVLSKVIFWKVKNN